MTTKPVKAFKIMGARTNNTCAWLYARKKIVALDSSTLEPIDIQWRYENKTNTITAKYFTDTDPNQRIIATLNNETIVLNIANISSNGDAVVAIKNNGQVTSWGSEAHGGVPPDNNENHNIRLAAGTDQVLLAVNSENQVIIWGSNENNELNVPDNLQELDIQQVRGAAFAICALGKQGNIVTWGTDTMLPPADIASLTDVKNIYSGFDFAVLRNTGQVASWGTRTTPTPPDIAAMTDIVDVAASGDGFAAIREFKVRKVVSWGNKDSGMDLPDEIAALDDIAEITGSMQFYAARRTNGSVVAWGMSRYGCENVPPDIATLTDIVDVQVAGEAAVAVLRENGTVMAWGGPTSGTVPEGLNNVVALSGVRGAFAALKSDGTVTGWGLYTTAGLEEQLTNVCGVYSNGNSFCAIKEDNTVVVWGDQSWGGDMNGLPDDLQGHISYEAE